MSSSTIVIFQGTSQYDVLNQFNNQLMKGFMNNGFNVELVDFTKSNWTNQLQDIINTKKIHFFISINAVASQLAIDGQSLFDRLDIPLVVLLVDHPYFHLERLIKGPSNLIIACVSRDHLNFIKKYMKLTVPMIFLPHGAVTLNSTTENLKTIKERNIDVLFAGTYSDPNTLLKSIKDNTPRALHSIIDNIIELAVFNNNDPLADIIEEVFKLNNLDEHYLLHQKIWEVAQYIDQIVRNTRRNKLISSLSSSDCNIKIFGNGWETINKNLTKNIEINGPISFTEVYEKMLDSKLVLSVLPYFTHGTHERILTAMYTGAVNLVDSNPYIKTNYINNDHIIYYGNNYQLQNKELVEILNNSSLLQTISTNSYKLVNGAHTWRHRAESLLSFMEQHKYLCN